MKNRVILVLATLLMSLAIAGCSTYERLVNVPETPFVWVDAEPSMATADKAIKRALVGRGWTGETVEPGLIRGQIIVRARHKAIVDIAFNEREYSITYVDSEDLDYRKTRGDHRGPEYPVIHRNYNRWVLALSQEINKEIASAANLN